MTLGFHINLFPGEESEISRLRKAWKNSEENRTAEINMLTWQVKRERERTLTLAERQKKIRQISEMRARTWKRSAPFEKSTWKE